MKRITLVCAQGMSTSMLVAKMDKVCKEKGLEARIIAIPDSRLADVAGDTDVLLLGPQIGFQQKKFQAAYPNLPVMVISNLDYGMMNGEKVLNQALALIKEK